MRNLEQALYKAKQAIEALSECLEELDESRRYSMVVKDDLDMAIRRDGACMTPTTPALGDPKDGVASDTAPVLVGELMKDLDRERLLRKKAEKERDEALRRWYKYMKRD